MDNSGHRRDSGDNWLRRFHQEVSAAPVSRLQLYYPAFSLIWDQTRDPDTCILYVVRRGGRWERVSMAQVREFRNSAT